MLSEVKVVVFIPLTQGQVTVIDFEDFEKVRPFKWRAAKCDSKWYARRGDGAYLHRFLLDSSKGFGADHKDGDGLNNQRENLRPATQLQNSRNSKIKKSNTSGFKGVSFRHDCNKYAAHIRHSGKKHHLGLFLTKEAAAQAYDVAAGKYHGEFASPNFPL